MDYEAIVALFGMLARNIVNLTQELQARDAEVAKVGPPPTERSGDDK